MLLSAFLYMGGFILSTLVAVLPASTGFPAEVMTAATTFGGYLGIAYPILPLETLHTIILLTISFEVTLFTFKFVRWVISFIPFFG